MPKVVYTAEQRAAAIALCAESGMGPAHRTTGIPKGTLSRWCSAAGVEVAGTERTAQAAEGARHAAAVARTTLVSQLRDLAVDAMHLEVSMAAKARAALDANDFEMLATLKALGIGGMHDVTGVRTRAIHDLQLLEGGATERAETTVLGAAPAEFLGAALDKAQTLRAVPDVA